MSETKIIGIAGTNGAGKDTIGQLLQSEYNFLFFSGSEMLRAELRRQGKPVIRQNTSALSAQWRREGGLGVMVDMIMAEFEKAKGQRAGVAMASLRNPGEADRVHELGGKVVWVDADPKVRYERIQSANRGRAGEDNKTYEQFRAEEKAEMHSSGDAATLDGAAVKAKADIFINNDGDEDELKQQIESLLS